MSSACSLTDKNCVPCEGGVPPLSDAEADKLLSELSGWTRQGKQITKTFQFSDFVSAMTFINKMADVAESEGHHPDFAVHYSKVDVTLWTHAIDGLSENDFILAAKLDPLA